jgi:hypothetical protein
MKKLLTILFLCITLTLSSFKGDRNLASEKYLNFIAAIENKSTFNYFAVIKVKNVNSGETKEVCTKGNFIYGALMIELNCGNDKNREEKVLSYVRNKKNLYFEFKNKKALENISFFDYDPTKLVRIERKYSIDKAVQFIKKNGRFSINLNQNEMKLFAHLLFNKGYMTGESDCFGGTLEYIDRTKPED